jgi:Ser/Thr protein kinase RdoA (MazF antagonist)
VIRVERWFDDVVYASWMTQRLLEAHQASSAILVEFGLEDAKVVGSAGGIDHANVMVLVESPDGRQTIRVHASEASEARVRSEIYWLSRLGERISVKVPEPLIGLDGSQMQTAQIDAGDRLCTAYSWLPGVRLAEEMEQPSAMIASIGRALAEIHMCGTSPEVPQWFSRPEYDVSTTAGAESLSGDDAQLVALQESGQSYGLIHRELGHHNILVDAQEGVSFIDFTTLGWGFFVHDIGTVVRGLREDQWDVFFEAYQSVRALPAAELKWIDDRLP